MNSSVRERTLFTLLIIISVLAIVLTATVVLLIFGQYVKFSDNNVKYESLPVPTEQDADLLANRPACANGKIWKPEDATVYKPTLATPRLQNKSDDDLQEYFRFSLYKLQQRFQTIIIDCPSPGFSGNFSREQVEFVKALAHLSNASNKYTTAPINVWLRMNEGSESLQDRNLCMELAKFGNDLQPGTIQGIVIHVEMLFEFAEMSDMLGEVFVVVKEKWQNFENATFNVLASHGLKFGLQINPVYCYELASQLPESTLRKFDKFFYIEENLKQFRIVNGVPILTLNDEYKECKHFLESSFPGLNTIKFVAPEKFYVRGSALRSYCLINA